MTAQVLDGRYRLIAPLATGGMSVVWRGYDEVLARLVAVKVIKSASDTAFTERVRREAMAIARLTHPHIATVYDYGESAEDGAPLPYIVMELVDGEDLAQVLRRGALTWPTAVGIAAQVAAALTCAHSNGVVHRDVTPRNVMICVDGVKLIDFGISAPAGARADRQIFGTPAYLAPERLSGDAVQPATDVYGLGLLLYEMLTGRLPWPLESPAQMLTAHQYARPAPLPPIRGLPSLVTDLCHRCLAVDPADRPGSADVYAHLAAAARTADRRARPGTVTTSIPIEHNVAPAPAGRRGSGTKVVPHGVERMIDTGAVTVPTGELDEAGTRRRPIFFLPSVLLVVLLGCLGLAEMHPDDGGAVAVPVLPSHSAPGPAAPAPVAPATPKAPGPSPSHRPASDPDRHLAEIACHVDYQVTEQWDLGYSAQLAITNVGDDRFAARTLEFNLGPGQRVVQGSNGRWQQHGRRVTVSDVDGDRTVAPGEETVVSFLAIADRTASIPARFTLNGTACH